VKDERLYTTIVAPHVSEKGTMLADSSRQFVFEVASSATKRDVRGAVEHLFKVEVDSVQVLTVRGKIKRFGRTPGKRKNWKKAYVRLKPGHDIDFMGAEQ